METIKWRKIISLLVFCILIITFVVAYPFFQGTIKKHLVLYKYNCNIQDMKDVVEQWGNMEYEYIYSDEESCNNCTISVGYPHRDIDAEHTNAVVSLLVKRKKCIYIEKYNDCVYFCFYASFGNGYGVACSLNGVSPKEQNDLVHTCEQLKYENWYFYIME